MDEKEVNLKPEDKPPFSICPGKAIVRIEFNEKLNVLIVASNVGDLFVVDPTLGEVLYKTHIGNY